MTARVIVLAGPSGSGKSRLADRSGLPVLRLDDFYRNGSDPALPRFASGPNAGVVDWDDVGSWLVDDALDTIAELCLKGRAQVPIYDIARDGRCGEQTFDLAGAPVFIAEGIFAPDIVQAVRERGLLEGAYCLQRSAMVTFGLRLVRDLREHRKPPLLLVRRGVALMRAQRDVVAAAVAKGCTPISPRDLARVLARILSASR